MISKRGDVNDFHEMIQAKNLMRKLNREHDSIYKPSENSLPRPNFILPQRALKRNQHSKPAGKERGIDGWGVSGGLLRKIIDVVDGIADSSNFIGILIRNFNAKFLLNRHDNLDRIQTIKSQIIREM